jgi:hypothetical protein
VAYLDEFQTADEHISEAIEDTKYRLRLCSPASR